MSSSVSKVSKVFTPKNIGTALGTAAGIALAPVTGGLSIPAAAAIGGGLGRMGGTVVSGGDSSDYLTGGIKGAALGYGAGSLATAAGLGAGGTSAVQSGLSSAGVPAGLTTGATQTAVGAIPAAVASSAAAGGSLLGGISPYVLGGAVIGSQYLGAQEAKKASEQMYNQQLGAIQQAQSAQMENIGAAQERATETWEESAFPKEELIESKKTMSTADINQRAQMAQKAFMDSMSARGITGGGQLAQGLAEIERSRQQQIAAMASDLTQFGLTPYSAPPVMTDYPGMAYPQVQPYSTFGQNMADITGGLTGTVGGMYAYDWLKGR